MANEKMIEYTINGNPEKVMVQRIGQKDYIMVHERVRLFRKYFPEAQLITSIISHDGKQLIMKAEVIQNQKVLSTGHAEEVKGSSKITATSYFEVCETSAIGRCLGNLGIGLAPEIGGGICTGEELETASARQEELNMLKDKYLNHIKKAIEDDDYYSFLEERDEYSELADGEFIHKSISDNLRREQLYREVWKEWNAKYKKEHPVMIGSPEVETEELTT